MVKKVGLILGTMTIGMQVFGKDAATMVDTAFQNGIRELDTAYVYNDGLCEQIVGQMLQNYNRSDYRIALKVSPKPAGNLDRETIRAQVTESLRRLQIEKADILYLHFPNHATPIAKTLEACMELKQEKKFEDLGISNFPLQLVNEILELCEKRRWDRPAVYEGVYNACNRVVEKDLLRFVHAAGMRFTAYNPLAGGFLTGKYKDILVAPEEGRFAKMKGYRDRYWKQSLFDGTALIRSACENIGIRMADAALRWLLFHSSLCNGTEDAVILGASNVGQLIQNCAAETYGPLPQEVVAAFDEAWELCAKDMPAYYRYIG